MQAGLTPAELRELARSLDRPSRKTAQHGTRSMYAAGCRCPGCRDAQAAYMRVLRGPLKVRARCAGVVRGGSIRRCTQFAAEGSGFCSWHQDQAAV